MIPLALYAKFLKAAISACAAYIPKNRISRPASELIYSFPLVAPMTTIHADLWVPGKTISFDGFIGLMIIICHRTGFSAIEPVVNTIS